MNIEKKLSNIPNIYYFNLDKDLDRRSYMEEQFDRFKITRFERVSGTYFSAQDIENWKHLCVGNYKHDLDYIVANFVTHINFLKNWLRDTNDDFLILMEDDYDISLIDHWHFSWAYLMERLPSNWDCIQLGYEHPDYIIFCMHHKPPLDHLFGPCLLNRTFVKKIVNLYFKNNKFILNNKTGFSKSFGLDTAYSVDTAIIGDGVTYRIPLITTNFDLCRPERKKILGWHENVSRTYHYWWENKKSQFDLEDFFTMGHLNAQKMTQPVKDYSRIKI